MLPPCVKCGYALGGLSPAGVCPECATPIAVSVEHAAKDPWPSPPLRRALWTLAAINAGALSVSMLASAELVDAPVFLIVMTTLLGIASIVWSRLSSLIQSGWVGARGAGMLGFVMVAIVIAYFGMRYTTPRAEHGPLLFVLAPLLFVRVGYVLISIHEIAGRLVARPALAVMAVVLPWIVAPILSAAWPPLGLSGWAAIALVLAFLARRCAPCPFIVRPTVAYDPLT